MKHLNTFNESSVRSTEEYTQTCKEILMELSDYDYEYYVRKYLINNEFNIYQVFISNTKNWKKVDFSKIESDIIRVILYLRSNGFIYQTLEVDGDDEFSIPNDVENWEWFKINGNRSFYNIKILASDKDYSDRSTFISTKLY